MDHIVFLFQERLQTAQVNLNSLSSRFSQNIGGWTLQAKSTILNSFQNLKDSTTIINMTGRLQTTGTRLKDFWSSFNLADIYNQCIYFLLTEVTYTHIYFGGMCFIFGTLVGVGMGMQICDNVVSPRKMRAVVATAYKGIDAICVVEDVNAPIIVSPNQVLIQVKSAGIDYIDIKIAEGYGRVLRQQLNQYNPNDWGELPVVLGRDCSGVVVSVGKDVTKVQPGDEVWLAVPSHHPGTLSEYIVVLDVFVALKPSQLSFEGAASLPYNIMKVWDALVSQAGLDEMSTAGKRILVHTGASGVGAIAIQLVHAWGGHVTTTIHSMALPLAHMLGADDIITYDTHDYEKELRVREKFHVVFNPLGPLPEIALLEFCLPGGCVVTSANPTFISDSYGLFMGTLYSIYIRFKHLFTKNPWLLGTGLGSLEVSGSVLERISSFVATGQLQAFVDKAYAASDSEAAFVHIGKGETFGKTVIRFRARPLVSRSNSFL